MNFNFKYAGTEALFADVGHFTVRSIQISMCSVTYPALILAYTGQASFLRKHNDLVKNTFFESIPGKNKKQKTNFLLIPCSISPLITKV